METASRLTGPWTSTTSSAPSWTGPVRPPGNSRRWGSTASTRPRPPTSPSSRCCWPPSTPRRIRVFTNIAVAFARSPMDLAQVSDDLQRLSGGRFVLGLGSQIRPHIEHRYSMEWSRPVARMGEMVGAIKAIHRTWNERVPLAFRGEIYRHTLMTPFFDPGPNPYGSPPVWVAALGPADDGQGGRGRRRRADPPVPHRHVRPRAHHAGGRGRPGAVGPDSARTFTVHATPIVCTGTHRRGARARRGTVCAGCSRSTGRRPRTASRSRPTAGASCRPSSTR